MLVSHHEGFRRVWWHATLLLDSLQQWGCSPTNHLVILCILVNVLFFPLIASTVKSSILFSSKSYTYQRNVSQCYETLGSIENCVKSPHRKSPQGKPNDSIKKRHSKPMERRSLKEGRDGRPGLLFLTTSVLSLCFGNQSFQVLPSSSYINNSVIFLIFQWSSVFGFLSCTSKINTLKRRAAESRKINTESRLEPRLMKTAWSSWEVRTSSSGIWWCREGGSWPQLWLTPSTGRLELWWRAGLEEQQKHRSDTCNTWKHQPSIHLTNMLHNHLW